MTKPNKIAIFGAGVWGSVLAQHLAKKGNNVFLWEYSTHLINEILAKKHHPHIPNFTFDQRIHICAGIEETMAESELVLLVIASKAVRSFARKLNANIKGNPPLFVSATKGIESQTGLTMCQILESEIPSLKNNAMSISGPSFALEVARAVPTKLVLSGYNQDVLQRTYDVFDGFPIKLEISSDRLGVEWGGSIKNVLAIACGILDGLGTGANTKAAFITQAMKEMEIIITAAGGRQETIYGLSGLGDFILTGTSTISRNRRLGEKIGQGKTVAQARGEINTVAEGLDSVESALDIIRRKNLNTPIIRAVIDITKNGESPEKLIKAMGF